MAALLVINDNKYITFFRVNFARSYYVTLESNDSTVVDFACDFLSIDIMKVSSQITMLLTFFPLQNGLLVMIGIFELMSS